MSYFQQNITDNELIALYCQQQNKNAFGELYNRYQHLVVSVCYKYLLEKELAKDAMMQIFEKLLHELPKQNNLDNFKAWLNVVSKNYCLMQLRKAKLPIKHTENIENYDVENEDEVHLAIQKEENINKMQIALEKLDPKQKNCIDLFYLQKKSYVEIQNITGYTFMEVKSFIQNGKRNLKICMEEQSN